MGSKTLVLLLLVAVFMGGLGLGVLYSKVVTPTVGQCLNTLLGQ